MIIDNNKTKTVKGKWWTETHHLLFQNITSVIDILHLTFHYQDPNPLPHTHARRFKIKSANEH